jgi:hypothetical protein
MIPLGDVIAQKLHDVVLNGRYGFDYTFDRKREKNLAFREKYCIDDKKIISILLRLTGAHYIKSESSYNEKHKDDVVHIFMIDEKLIPKYEEDADPVSVSIYIKVTWPKSDEIMFIISFHESEERK